MLPFHIVKVWSSVGHGADPEWEECGVTVLSSTSSTTYTPFLDESH